jgi:DnaJ-domain-containing protein 1
LCSQQRLGEALVASGCLSQRELLVALSMQREERLHALFALSRARLRFNVARGRNPSGTPPLRVAEFLTGRPRARDGRRPAARGFQHGVVEDGQEVSAALALLGLDEQASPDAIRSAYRKRAATLHPDRYPEASAVERVGLNQRFARLTAAYRLLVA